MKRFITALIAGLISCLTLPATVGDTTVAFVNVYPGSDIYELEGHSALRLTINNSGDWAVSYGQFDFNSPNFVYRFVKGETDYSVALIPWQYFENAYREQDRRMVQHTIDISAAQKQRLIDLVEENLRPENRVYRYNYVKDNCATRPLRILELALGDSIVLGIAPAEANSSRPMTYRNIMRHYHRNYPWYQFGIDLALGSGIDYPISRREAAFAPAELDRQLASAIVGGRKLVSSSDAIIDLPQDNAILSPTPWYLTPMAVAVLVLVLTLAVCVRDIRDKHITQWLHSLHFAAAALLGLILTFLIFVSVHEATSPNWLYVWLNPLSLIAAVGVWLKSCKTLVMSYHFANFVALFLLSAAWAWIPQSANPAFAPLIAADMILSATYIIVNIRNRKASPNN